MSLSHPPQGRELELGPEDQDVVGPVLVVASLVVDGTLDDEAEVVVDA